MGTALDVFTSMAISFRFSRSKRSRKGSLMAALPMTIFLRRPEMMKAVSGGAFLYHVQSRTTRTIARRRMANIPGFSSISSIILASFAP